MENKTGRLLVVVVAIVMALIIAVLFLILLYRSSIPEKNTQETLYNMSMIETHGNHSYIPMKIFNAEPKDYTREILEALNTFEKAHPELEVTGWKIEKQQNAHLVTPEIFGLWVDHKLRKSD